MPLLTASHAAPAAVWPSAVRRYVAKAKAASDPRMRKIFAPTMHPTSSLRLPHSTNFWQWSEEETMSWWDPWWEKKSYAF